MPIIPSIPLKKYTQSEFGRIAYEVVGHAFAVHGTLGRLLDESDYRSSVAILLGRRAIEELKIFLLHDGYEKEVFVDLVVDCGCPFELKVASALLGGEQQCLQTTETYWNGQRVGRREVYMVNGCTAFEISCSREGPESPLSRTCRNS